MMEKILLIIVMLFALNVEVFARGHVAIFLSALTTDSLSVHKEKALDSVTVVGSNVTHYADHDVFYITRSMRKGARNTVQMLGSIPGIDCNRADNSLTYHGSSKIVILVDSVEKPSDFIKELHHLRFQKVDVFPNPSGKYADYDVLLNLHTRKNYEGYEGNVVGQVSAIPTDGNGQGKNLTGAYGSFSTIYTWNKWNFVVRYDGKFNQGGKTDLSCETVNHVNGLRVSYEHPEIVNYFRLHNIYTAVDYQFNDRHSLSFSYKFSTDASDAYSNTGLHRQWLADGRNEFFTQMEKNGVNSQRHILGVHYRGRSGCWNYTQDFNYINDGWDADRFLSQSLGFGYDYRHRKHMDYVHTRSEVNRRFFCGRFYVSAGYNFTLKKYEQTDRPTGSLLSRNKYLRNEFWTWASYRFSNSTDLNFSASAERVSSESSSTSDANWIYNLGGKFYHRWNKWLWMRLTHSTGISHPQLDQVTEYGYFTDSLTWQGGNPSLRTQAFHTSKLYLDFFNFFNLEAGYSFSNNLMTNVTGMGEGQLPSGQWGGYVTNVPYNTLYREWWVNFYVYKRIKSFTLSANARYQHQQASFMEDKNTNGGLSGRLSALYYNVRYRMAVQAIYDMNNNYSAFVQGWNTQKIDCLFLYVGKDFLGQRLNVALQYVSPSLAFNGKKRTATHCAALDSDLIVNVFKSTGNSMMLTLNYRFQGGKSVRQYNRNVSEEK